MAQQAMATPFSNSIGGQATSNGSNERERLQRMPSNKVNDTPKITASGATPCGQAILVLLFICGTAFKGKPSFPQWMFSECSIENRQA